jgi:proline iminopeptidase
VQPLHCAKMLLIYGFRFYQSGASFLFPDAWDKYLEAIPAEEHGDLVRAYHTRLTSPDHDIQMRAAKAWSIWEGSTSKLYVDPNFIQKFSGDTFALAFARIESHYFFNRGFFETDNWILENVHKICSIPCVIVQGRYDVVCPMTSAWDLKKAYPAAELVIVADAGHSAQEPGIISALVAAANNFRELNY